MTVSGNGQNPLALLEPMYYFIRQEGAMRLLRLAIEYERWDLAALCLALGVLKAHDRGKSEPKPKKSNKTGLVRK